MKYIKCTKDKGENLEEKLKFSLILTFLLCFQIALTGQIKPLDNWDLEVIGKGNLQSETYLDVNSNEAVDITGLNQLFRYGVSKNFELQAQWNGLRYDATPSDYTAQSTSLGVKAYVYSESKYLPGISLIGSINLTMNPDERPLLPSLNVLFRKKIIENISLTGNYHFILNEQEGDFSNTFAVNLDVEVTTWLTSYIGIKDRNSFVSVGDEDFIKNYLELGALFWIADGWRLYPFYNIGLDDNAGNVLNIGMLYQFK